ncbi:MAG TPA: hypothetical protein VGI63_01360 [Verrucomicrobiae bacterium]
MQIIELVTGIPSTLKTTSAAGGTPFSAGLAACAREFSEAEIVPPDAMAAAGIEDDCPLTFDARIAAKNVQAKTMLANRFTKIVSDDKNSCGKEAAGRQSR